VLSQRLLAGKYRQGATGGIGAFFMWRQNEGAAGFVERSDWRCAVLLSSGLGNGGRAEILYSCQIRSVAIFLGQP
jgi:hypothetical protein